MTPNRLVLVYTGTILLTLWSLVILFLLTSPWKPSYFFNYWRKWDGPISFRSTTFNLYNLTLTNGSVVMHGYITGNSRQIPNDIIVYLDNGVIKDIFRPTVETRKYFLYPGPKVVDANCALMIKGDESYLKELKVKTRVVFPPRNIITSTQHCLGFKLRNGYVTEPLFIEEANYPVAFSISVSGHENQAERLLRSIYRPQNVYCIHVDSEAERSVLEGMASVARCFDNVFLSSRSVTSRMGTPLQADLICMDDLWKYKKWNYFINLSEKDFPLKTNLELVRLLMSYNGTNDVAISPSQNGSSQWTDDDPPPFNMTLVHGEGHVMVTRQFVDYVLHNQTAHDLLNFVNESRLPDVYFSTLNNNPDLQVPGTSVGDPDTDGDARPSLARFAITNNSNSFNLSCTGRMTSDSVCVLGEGDLHTLTLQPHAFAGPVSWNFQYTLGCLEEWHHNRTRDEFLRDS